MPRRVAFLVCDNLDESDREFMLVFPAVRIRVSWDGGKWDAFPGTEPVLDADYWHNILGWPWVKEFLDDV